MKKTFFFLALTFAVMILLAFVFIWVTPFNPVSYKQSFIIIGTLLFLALVFLYLSIMVTDKHDHIEEQADALAEALDLDNLKDEILQEITDQRMQPILDRMQDEILRQTATMPARNRGAFNAFVHGLNQQKDVPMLELIAKQLEKENLTLTGKVEDIFTDSWRLTDDEKELVYEYYQNREKKV